MPAPAESVIHFQARFLRADDRRRRQATFGTAKCRWTTSVTAPRSRGWVARSVGTIRVLTSGIDRFRTTSSMIGPTRFQAAVIAPDNDQHLRGQAGHDRSQTNPEPVSHALDRLLGARVAAVGEAQQVVERQGGVGLRGSGCRPRTVGFAR